MAIQIGERDKQILEDHLPRYRVTTPAVLTQRFFNGSEVAMKSSVKRLKGKAGLLAADKLYPRGKEVYYFASSAPPVSNPDDLARLIGVLYFCVGGKSVRERLLVEDFERLFGTSFLNDVLRRRLPYGCLYLDQDAAGEKRLGRVIIDTGGGTEIVFRAKKALTEDAEVLRPFLAEGRYCIALVVPSEQKAKTVERQLKAASLLDLRGEHLRVVVEAHEVLAGLLLDGGSRR